MSLLKITWGVALFPLAVFFDVVMLHDAINQRSIHAHMHCCPETKSNVVPKTNKMPCLEQSGFYCGPSTRVQHFDAPSC